MKPLAALAAVAILAGPAAAREKSDVEKIGDVLQYVLPVTAAGMTVAYRDWQGTVLFAKSFAATAVSTWALKKVTNVRRPGGSASTESFPSGHTSAAFSGASFVQRRYGWRYALPLYAAAAFVAFSRVDANRHRPEEVAAGALIGIGWTYVFTKPLEDSVYVTPLVDAGSYGMVVHVRW
jgi:membrane-associated phospholipid phosphatase